MNTDPVKHFHVTSVACSKIVTSEYSTSFYSAIRMLHPDLRDPIYSIYGFVRLADEIVDSFHDYDKTSLIYKFKEETLASLDRGISLNPILNSFQFVVHQFNINIELIHSFFKSMEMDLKKSDYQYAEELNDYIYGSAEVVGLMCLYVFCEGNQEKFNLLKPSAKALGAAFQKVNFLRDLKADHEGLSRSYFPGFQYHNFDKMTKRNIEDSIASDFREAHAGILRLPAKARFGVYVAYKYYYSLFKKIKRLQPRHIIERRVRIPDYSKAILLLNARIQNQLNLIR